jgi:hypothetical protein
LLELPVRIWGGEGKRGEGRIEMKRKRKSKTRQGENQCLIASRWELYL